MKNGLDTTAMKRNLFEKQISLRRILHNACDIADRGESLLALDPRAMTESQWVKMGMLAKKIYDISTQCAGAVELKRAFAKSVAGNKTMKKNLERLIS